MKLEVSVAKERTRDSGPTSLVANDDASSPPLPHNSRGINNSNNRGRNYNKNRGKNNNNRGGKNGHGGGG